MRRKLNGIVALLALPIMILASLWLSGEYDRLKLHRRAQTGIETVLVLWQELNVNYNDGVHAGDQRTAIDHFLERIPVDGLSPPQLAFLERALSSDSEDRRGEGILLAIGHAVDQSGMTMALNANQKLLVDMLAKILPESGYHVRMMVDETLAIAQENALNDRHRLAIVLAAGQMKTAVDHAARSQGVREALGDRGYQSAAGHIKAVRDANAVFQRQTTAIAISTLQSSPDGFELGETTLADYQAASRELLVAIDEYWHRLAGELDVILASRHRNHELLLGVTGAVCVTLIAVAVGLALSLGTRLTKQTEQQFARLSLFDPLTGLPNRRALKREISEMLTVHRGVAASIGLICIDLKNFKAINDRFGESEGDAILREVSRTLEQATVSERMLARIGGDQFAVLVGHEPSAAGPGDDARYHLERLANELVELVQTMRWQEHSGLELSVFAGVAVQSDASADSAADADELLRNAEMALRAAKSTLKPSVRRFSVQMREEFDRDRLLADRLEAAIGRGEIEAWFQPQIGLRERCLLGFEALARWRCPDTGMIVPNLFLPAASKAGLMPAIEREIRRQAFAAMRRWLDAGLDLQHVGVNTSAYLLDDPSFAHQLFGELTNHRLEPAHVGIEILESVMVEGPHAACIRTNIEELARAGCHIELDDFGTGHAGLSSLRQLKFNRVKIDRSFVAGVHRDAELQTLTRALIELARSLQIEVLAEGVETEAEKSWLRDHHCTAIQGYLIAKPMPYSEAMAWAQDFTAMADRPDRRKRPSIDLDHDSAPEPA